MQRSAGAPPSGDGEPGADLLETAGGKLLRYADREKGGFGQAPKFPHAVDLRVLLRVGRRFPDVDPERPAPGDPHAYFEAFSSLKTMFRGGIYDHLGGGFHRYSTDADWLVPHFEKMLYDQALLVPALWKRLGSPGGSVLLEPVRGTCDYVLREMIVPGGAFAAAQDADTDGEEGKLLRLGRGRNCRGRLGEPLGWKAAAWFDIAAGGHWEGTNVLNRSTSVEHGPGGDPINPSWALGGNFGDLVVPKLLAHRDATRTRPFRDDKVVASWNGLMIGALGRAAAVLGEPKYADAALAAADFIRAEMWSDGVLSRSWKDGRRGAAGFAEDDFALADGLCELWQARQEPRLLAFAGELVEAGLDRFGGPTPEAPLFQTAAERRPAGPPGRGDRRRHPRRDRLGDHGAAKAGCLDGAAGVGRPGDGAVGRAVGRDGIAADAGRLGAAGARLGPRAADGGGDRRGLARSRGPAVGRGARHVRPARGGGERRGELRRRRPGAAGGQGAGGRGAGGVRVRRQDLRAADRRTRRRSAGGSYRNGRRGSNIRPPAPSTACFVDHPPATPRRRHAPAVPVRLFQVRLRESPLYGLDDVLETNPQRFEMLQLHGVVHVDKEAHGVVGFVDLKEDDFWCRGHFPGYPLMPGVLQCEAAAQLAGFYARKFKVLGGDFVGFGGIENVRFRAPVRPPCRLIVAVRVTKLRPGRRAVYDIQGFVDDTMVFNGGDDRGADPEGPNARRKSGRGTRRQAPRPRRGGARPVTAAASEDVGRPGARRPQSVVSTAV